MKIWDIENDYFRGRVGDVKIYERALSSDDISRLYWLYSWYYKNWWQRLWMMVKETWLILTNADLIIEEILENTTYHYERSTEGRWLITPDDIGLSVTAPNSASMEKAYQQGIREGRKGYAQLNDAETTKDD